MNNDLLRENATLLWFVLTSQSKKSLILTETYWNDIILFGKFRINIAEEIDTILKSHYMKICGRTLKVYFPIFAKLHCGLAVVNVEHILRLALLLQFLNLNSNILLSETQFVQYSSILFNVILLLQGISCSANPIKEGVFWRH